MLRCIAFVVSALVLVPISDSVAVAQGRLCFAREATITGTEGADVLHGTPGNDVILGLGGEDVVRGGEGNDRICGGDGADSIRGGSGADRIDGNADTDTIAAGRGRDLADGGSGNDSIGGGSGRDSLVGQGGADVLDGGGGRDRITYFLARGDVRANLATHRASGEGFDTLVHLEDLEGSPYDDVLVGDVARNKIDGATDPMRCSGPTAPTACSADAGTTGSAAARVRTCSTIRSAWHRACSRTPAPISCRVVRARIVSAAATRSGRTTRCMAGRATMLARPTAAIWSRAAAPRIVTDGEATWVSARPWSSSR
jgi:hypothetical protein